MTFSITSFAVSGLFGDTDISVDIADNRLVVVGVNGLGKSTFLNLFYYFISRQWSRLLEYDFGSLTAVINKQTCTLTRDELETPKSEKPDFEASVAPVAITSRARLVLDAASSDLRFRNQLQRALATAPLSRVSDLISSFGFPFLGPSDLRSLRSALSRRATTVSDNVNLIGEFLDRTLNAQILFLPTYRRIEKDLNTVLPGLDDELRRFHDNRRRSPPELEASYLELVEFGMEDVSRNIRQTLDRQKETARTELNNLAGSYLRDVLRRQGSQYDAKLIASLSDAAIEDILNRVEERTLNEGDKETLRNVIRRIRQDESLDSSDGYVAHFFEKLVVARDKLRKNEVPISQFTEVCNAYLVGKQLTYDDVKYTIEVKRNNREIELASLSSGEKQIVSLFSQVYIGASDSYIIVIDEPELSLSVNWQQRLLPDLENSQRCAFVAAVTHSPYIFDNSFDPYAIDLSLCIKIRGDDSPISDAI